MSKEIDIDFVISWVNDEDTEWQEKKKRYLPTEGEDVRPARYRDWGLLPFLFRGFDVFSPWVRKIFLVTDCRLPDWLDTKNPKLVVVDPNSLIPKEYAPTFNINAIEINFHKIPGLSEHFVYFNDDMLLLKPLEKTDFFRDGKPCDYAALSPVLTTRVLDVASIMINDMGIINQHFNKKEVVNKNLGKWINIRYGTDNIKTLCVLPFHCLPGFANHHLPQSFLKSTFEKIWSLEEGRLTEVCQHRFRNYYSDINQWLFRYWQLCEGEFVPSSKKRGKYLTVDRCDEICSTIKRGKQKMICINDSDSIDDITVIRSMICDALSEILPDKSSFEIA
ncbi:MAG: Stealth CR1 domain-containing protein [Saccharofermentans sp.]|nr:Stealth CR1 domain-containing protein [Saccharofermentans sp.]